jgi:hypothetical protein
MKRLPFFPSRIAERPAWFHNFATQLPLANAVLGQDATVVANLVKDARYCEYVAGAWLTWARENGERATAALEDLYYGTGGVDFELPVFTPPAPDTGVVVVPVGALTRILDFAVGIKRVPTYSAEIGFQLMIIGNEDTAEHPVPEFTLEVERGSGSECVKVRFKKFKHKGVVIYSRRAGGAWEQLAIDLVSPYLDERPLLVPAQPEAREYRLQYYDDEGANGDFSPVQGVTVNP